jgi:hypothetical protein
MITVRSTHLLFLEPVRRVKNPRERGEAVHRFVRRTGS